MLILTDARGSDHIGTGFLGSFEALDDPRHAQAKVLYPLPVASRHCCVCAQCSARGR